VRTPTEPLAIRDIEDSTWHARSRAAMTRAGVS
jgi:hypothetical protein